MKQKNGIKCLLDLGMLCVLVLLYNKRSLGMTFHEIGGLALLGAFGIHLLLNAKWIATVTKKLAQKGTALSLRVGWLVDALLLCCFAAIAISGILISHVLFSFGGGMGWKTVHYFASALSLVLMGIHLGLHTAFLAGMVRKLRLPARAMKPVAMALAVLLFGFGCYNLVTTSFLQWLTMPFSAGTMQQSGRPDESRPALPEGMEPGEALPDGALPEQPGATTTQQQDPPALPDGVTAIDENAKGFGKQREGANEGEGRGNGGLPQGGEGQGGSAISAVTTMVQFFSIVFVFAALTAGLRRLAKKNRNNTAEEGASN